MSSSYGCGKLEVLTTNIVVRGQKWSDCILCCWISGYFPLSVSVTTIATIYQPGDKRESTLSKRNCTGCCRCECPQVDSRGQGRVAGVVQCWSQQKYFQYSVEPKMFWRYFFRSHAFSCGLWLYRFM